MWEQKQKQQKKSINNQNKSNLGFKNGMLGKFVWKKQANIKKGKARKRKIKKPKILIFYNKMDKKQRDKMEFSKGRQKENQKRKQNRKKRRIWKTGLLGEQNRQKNSKIAGKLPFWAFYKTQAQKHRQQKTKPPKSKKNIPKKNLFAFWQTTPIFGNFLFLQVAFFHVYKAVFCWKHYKNSVFSRTQLLGITDSKTPFRVKTQNGTFATKSAILGFPLCLLKPLIFVVFGDFEWARKKDHFPKTDSSEAWGPPQFQEKRSRREKAILGALGEFRGILGAALGIGNSILGIRNSILGMASHDLINTKPTILGATLGAIPGIAAKPPERFSFAPAFSERFFKNWGGSRAPE